jgi:hypothetical protein
VIYPGHWCDVVPFGDDFAFVRQTPEGRIIAHRVGGPTLWDIQPKERVLYLRAVEFAGEVWAIGQGHESGEAWLLSGTETGRGLGPTHGQNCTALAVEDGRLVAYIQRTDDTYSRWELGGLDVRYPIPIGPTSQGWLDVVNG